MSNQEMAQEIARLQAENAKLMASKQVRMTLKVSEKGGLSLYGMGRFPVTLYRSQWIKLLDFAETIRAFIDANKDKLREKDDAPATPKASILEQVAQHIA